MPNPRPDSQGIPGPLRAALHDRICGSDEPDPRYSGMTNHQKFKYLCGVLGYPETAFDLDLPLAIEDWLASDDNSLVCAGLYLNDLRAQFYAEMMAENTNTTDDLWGKEAEAQFWQFRFNQMINRRTRGAFVQDMRVLH